MVEIIDPELRNALDKLDELLRYSRDLIRFQYCRLDLNSRTTLPGDRPRPAIVVPLDHESVVPVAKPRRPFSPIDMMLESRLPVMTGLSLRLIPMGALCQAPQEQVDDVSPYWNNEYFTGADARIAYAFTRMKEPRRIVEVGSGNSTRFFRKAISDGKLRTRLISIDPAPRLEVAKVADEIIRQSVVDVPVKIFADLAPGDIIFFDGSHLCFHGSDVSHFFLSILPIVPKGVFVHIHDIFLPQEYPQHFDTRYYNEQYVLAAFLLHNVDWHVIMPVHYLYEKKVLNGDGGSFWIERTGS